VVRIAACGRATLAAQCAARVATHTGYMCV